MKIFLTGASGFLGSHVVEALAREGHALSALVRASSPRDLLRSHGVRLVEGALPQTKGLAEAMAGVDGVIHVAGAVQARGPQDFLEANTKGTEAMVACALAAQPRPKFFLHVSTLAVHRPNSENHFELPPESCRPLSHYGESKRQAELALHALRGKISYLVLRPPVLYGPRDREFLPFFKAIRFGVAPVMGSGQGRISVCYGPDVAEAIARLLRAAPPSGSIFSLSDGQVYPWTELARGIATAMGRSPKILKLPRAFFYLAASLSELKIKLTGRPDVFTLNKMKELTAEPWVCSNDALRAALAWSPPTRLAEGMAQTYESYRQLGWIS